MKLTKIGTHRNTNAAPSAIDSRHHRLKPHANDVGIHFNSDLDHEATAKTFQRSERIRSCKVNDSPRPPRNTRAQSGC